jgi:hypothetical protein
MVIDLKKINAPFIKVIYCRMSTWWLQKDFIYLVLNFMAVTNKLLELGM